MAEENAEADAGGKDKPRTSTAQLAIGAGVNMSDENESALFFQNKGKYERLLAAKKAADKALQDLGKIVKAEHGENGLDAIKLAIKLQTEDGAAGEIEAKLALFAKVKRWMGFPTGYQPDMFDAADRRPAEDVAFDRGKLAGMEGLSQKEALANAGYDSTSPLGQRFIAGWHKGQEAIFNIKEPPKAEVVKLDGRRKAKDKDAGTGEGAATDKATTH